MAAAAAMVVGCLGAVAWHLLAFDERGSKAELPIKKAEGRFRVDVKDSGRGGDGSPSPKTGATKPVAPTKGSAFEATRLEFQRSTNLHDFFHRALAKPESGGRYYADQVSQLCDALTPTLGEVLTQREAAIAAMPRAAIEALEALKHRCMPYQERRQTLWQQMAGLRDERQGVDPLLRFSDQLRKLTGQLNTPQALLKFYEEGKALGDPYVLSELLVLGAPEILHWIDPSSFNSEDSASVANAAALAVACELKGTCLWSNQVLFACIIRAECDHSDEQGLWRAQVAPEQQVLFDKAVALLRQQAGLGS